MVSKLNLSTIMACINKLLLFITDSRLQKIWICGLLEAELHICVYVGKKQINNCLGLIYSLPWPDTQTANQGTREIPVVRFQIESSLLFAYAHKRGRCFFVLPVIFGFEL